MLKSIRESSQSGAMYLLVALLIVVFALFFGMPTDGCQPVSGPRYLASVGDDEIYTTELRMMMRRVPRPRQETEEQYNAAKSITLRGLVIIHLLADRAREAGFRVSDEELVRYIKDPLRNREMLMYYGPGGEFDGTRYQNHVQYRLGVSIPQYQEFKRRELLARKYIELAEMQVGVLDGEVRQLADLKNTKVNLAFVKLRPEALTPFVEVGEQKVQQFVAEHPDEIEAYYKANTEEFSEPEKFAYRRIYILKPGAQAGAEERKKAIAKFDEAKKRVLEKKEDFGKVAADLSEDAAREKKGLMELTSVDNMTREVVDVLRDTKIGEVSEVTTDYAFMLVKPVERVEAEKTPLAEVREQIARTILQEREVEELIESMTDELRKKAGSTGSLSEALEVLEQQAAASTGDENGEDTADEAAGDEEGTEPEAAAGDEDTEGGAEEEAPAPNPWEALSVQKTGKFTLEGRQPPPGLPPQLLQMGMNFSSWDRIPRLGKSREIALDAFRKLSEEEPVADKIYEVDGARVLVSLVERESPDDDLGTETRLRLVEELRGRRTRNLLGRWFELFYAPAEDYGPWIESIYDQAVDKNVVRYNDEAEPAAPLIEKGSTKQGDAKKDGAKQGGGEKGGGEKGDDEGAAKKKKGAKEKEDSAK